MFSQSVTTYNHTLHDIIHKRTFTPPSNVHINTHEDCHKSAVRAERNLTKTSHFKVLYLPPDGKSMKYEIRHSPRFA